MTTDDVKMLLIKLNKSIDSIKNHYTGIILDLIKEVEVLTKENKGLTECCKKSVTNNSKLLAAKFPTKER